MRQKFILYNAVLLIGLQFTSTAQDSTWFSPVLSGDRPGYAGVWLNANGDQRLDLWYCGGQGQSDQHLFISEGGNSFGDSLLQYGLYRSQYLGGSVAGDVDNDGWVDLFMSSRDNAGTLTGPGGLYINSRNSSFADMAPSMGLARGGTGETALFFDYDGDGDLDLFVVYNHTEGTGAFLYRNDGDRFVEVLSTTGLERDGWFEGAQSLDFNDDGYIDLAYGGKLFLNNGDGTFRLANIGVWTTADEGICFADLDNRGIFDLVHNPSINGLYRINVFRNDGVYLDHWTDSLGVADSILINHWGVTAVDVDNDGFKDLLIGCRSESGVLMGNFIALKNLGHFKFADYTKRWNLDFKGSHQAFSDMVAPADFDNDGQMDFYLVSNSPGYRVWHNESNNDRFLNVRVTGQNGQLNQFGARVYVRRSDGSNDHVQTDFVGSGPGYAVKGQYDIHFGLSPNTAVDIEAVFPSPLGHLIRVNKAVNPALGGIIPRALGVDATSRTVEIRRNGDVVINDVLSKAANPTTVTARYPLNVQQYVPAKDSLVRLLWEVFPGSLNYDVQIFPESRFDTSAVSQMTVLTTEAVVSTRNMNRLYWRVRATIASRSTPWSEPFSVILDTVGLPYRSYVVNHAPVFPDPGPVNAREDSLLSFKVSATDADSNTLAGEVRYRLASASPWLTIDSVSGIISGTPRIQNLNDTSVVVEAIDRKGGVSRCAIVVRVQHVNHVPEIISTPVFKAKEDSQYLYRVVAHDVDTLVGDVLGYSLSRKPSWLNINSTTGLIIGTPRGVNVGDTIVTVRVSDGVGGIATQTYQLNVLHTNHAPVFVSVPDTIAQEDSLYVYGPAAIDQDSELFADSIRYSLGNPPTWLSIDSVSGLLTGTPIGLQAQDTIVVIEADDGKGGISVQEFILHGIHVNHAPVLLSNSLTIAKEDSFYEFRLSAVDKDTVFGDMLSYNLTGPQWISMNSSNGLLSGIPRGLDVGNSFIEIVVDDGQGGTASRQLTLSVEHTNHNPVFASVPDTIAIEDQPYSYKFFASDQDSSLFGDIVTYRFLIQPSWLSLDSVTGMISGTPEGLNVLDTVVSVAAYDGKDGVAVQTYNLPIIHVNHPATISSSPPNVAKEDSLYVYDVKARDVDTQIFGDTLAYGFAIRPSWLFIDSRIGVTSGIPQAWNVGDTVVSINVNDGKGGISIQGFDLTVLHTNHSPVILSTPPIKAVENFPYTYRIQGFDKDILFGDILTARILTGPVWLNAQSSELRLMGLPKPENVGDTLVTVQLSDGVGGTAVQSFTIEIAPSPVTSRTSFVLPIDSQSVSLELPAKPMTFLWDNPSTGTSLGKGKAIAQIAGFVFSLKGQNVDTTVSGIADTSITLGIMSKLQPNSQYFWNVKGVDQSNVVVSVDSFSFRTTEVQKALNKISSRIPKTYELEQNYPNPFNSATAIEFGVPEPSRVSLIVYNVLGQEVGRVLQDRIEPGVHRFYWESRGLPSGVYFLRMKAESEVDALKIFYAVKKLVLLK